MKKLIFLFLILPIGLLAQTKLDPIMIKPGMLTVTELHVANENSKIYIDAEGNLVLRDSQAGEKKLSELVTVDVQSDETLTGTGTGLDPLGVNTTSIATKTDLDNYWNKTELTNTEKQRINDIGNALQFQGVSISSLSPTDGKIWVFRSGSWILEDKPLPSGAPAWGEITGTLSGQTDLQNALDGKQATLTGNEPIFSNWDKDASDDFSGDYNDLLNRPAIPSSLSELADDPNHRTVTDAEKANWNSKLSAEVDGSVTNEIQTLSLEGTNLSISGAGGNTVDLSSIGRGGSAVPGGTNGQIQFNNNGSLDGFGNWNGTTLTLSGFLNMEDNEINFSTAEFSTDEMYNTFIITGNDTLELTGSQVTLYADEIIARAVNSGSFEGIKYQQDYSTNFTDRSLVDKAYVDNIVASGSNNSVQSLSGTSPIWNTASGINATITLSGNTTIAFSNLTTGQTGNLTVINASTAYSLGFSGYTVVISPFIHSSGDEVTTSGNSLIDCFSWYYDGTRVIVNGTLGYQ